MLPSVAQSTELCMARAHPLSSGTPNPCGIDPHVRGNSRALPWDLGFFSLLSLFLGSGTSWRLAAGVLCC